MNEFCAIGLHSFSEWQDSKDGNWQSRSCRECKRPEQRPWEPEAKPAFDPYSDLHRKF